MPPLRNLIPWIVLAATLTVGCATTGGRGGIGDRPSEVGVASYYASRFHGRRTASGEFYDQTRMTAAHPSLPFGTRVRVTNLTNDRTVVLRINDRGPFKRGRILDVSRHAARELGLLGPGTARIRLVVLEP